MYGIHILLPDNLEIDQQAPTTPDIPTASVTVRILGVWTLWAFEPAWLGTGTKDRHVKNRMQRHQVDLRDGLDFEGADAPVYVTWQVSQGGSSPLFQD